MGAARTRRRADLPPQDGEATQAEIDMLTGALALRFHFEMNEYATNSAPRSDLYSVHGKGLSSHASLERLNACGDMLEHLSRG